MAARFDKDAEKTFDGFDGKTVYQMVPVRDRRDVAVVTETSACQLAVDDPAVATMANFSLNGAPVNTPSLTADSVTVPPRSRLQFSVLGKAAGPTLLTLDDGSGRPPASLRVSVKETLARTFSLLFLADTKRATTRPQADAAAKMKAVAATFLLQANVRLTQVVSATVTAARDLRNPLVVDRVFADIISATPLSAFSPQNIRIYCCWDVADTAHAAPTIIGDTIGQDCFVEDGTDQFTFGHEVGHALGLDFHNGKSNRLMFFQITGRSSKLDQFEIDTINPSGTAP